MSKFFENEINMIHRKLDKVSCSNCKKEETIIDIYISVNKGRPVIDNWYAKFPKDWLFLVTDVDSGCGSNIYACSEECALKLHPYAD